MKRLIADNTKAIEQMIKGSAKDGREILKALEEFKFKIEQCTRVSTNEEINDKIHQHYDMLDKLMSGLYSICFDLENVNLVPLYDNDQINLSDQSEPDSSNSGYNLNEEIPADVKEETTENQEEPKNNEEEESVDVSDNESEEEQEEEEEKESEEE